MAKNSKSFRKIGVALAVSALTGSVIGTTWAATNVAGTGNGVALGEGAAATSNDANTSIAIGKDSTSKYDGSIAIGDGSEAVGNDSIVIGKGASTISGPGIAIGSGAHAQNDGNLAIGVGAKSVGKKSIVIGENTSAGSGRSIVLGYNTHTSGYTTNAIAMGENIKLDGNYSDLISIGSESNAQGIGSIAIGGDSTIAAPVTGAVALGYGAATTAEGGVALGRSSVANRSAGSYGYIPQSGDKIGYTGRIGGILPDREAVFTAQKPANVDDSVYKSTDGAVSVGRESYVGQNGNVVPVSTRQITNVAAGGQDTDAVNVRQLKDLSAAVGTQLATKLDANAFQYVSINSSEAGNKDNKGATGGNSVAIGPNATATAVSNVAIGEDSVAGGKGFATALGSGAKAENTGAVAIGSSANATGSTGIAMGYEAKATGTNAVALGMRSQATSYGIAIGQAKALSQSAIVLGDAANIDNASAYAIGIGDGVSVTNTKQAVVAGVNAKADNSQQVVLLGSQANATNSGNSVVIGTSASSNSVETVAIGKGTIITDKAASSLAIGNSAYIGEMTPVDPGTKPSDTSNPGYRNIGTSEEVMTNPLDKSKYYFSTAVGTDAKAFGYQNTAFGAGAEAHNTNSLALGFIAVAKGDFSAAIGRNTKTDGTYATAVGFDADAIGESTLALGSRARANKVAGVALGTDSITNVDKGSFGYDPSGKQADLSAFLGDQKSVYDTLQTDIATAQGEVDTARQAVIDLQNSKNGKTAEEIAEIDKNLASAETTLDEKKAALTAKVTEANKMVSTWQATAAGVSVGDSETGLTRQINNVAAGTLDTDAVNVAQLKAAKVEVVAGDNVTVDTDTSAGYTKYTVKSVDTDTKVENGAATYNADGTGSITLNTNQNGTTGTVTISGLQDKFITGASMSGNTLTINRNDGQAFTVNNIATKDDVTSAQTHYVSINSTESGNRDNKGATTTGAIAIGPKAGATNWYDIAIGNNAKASGSWSVALGADTNASGSVATALGYGAQSTNAQTIAMGYTATASGPQATAIGREAKATGLVAIALGTQSKANADDSISIGRGTSVVSQGVNSIAIGQKAYIGQQTTAGGTPEQGVPDHSLSIVDNDTSSGKADQEYMNSIAIGNTTKAFGYQNTSLGAGAETYDTNTTAVGVAAKAKGHYATAMGKQAYANGEEATALGHWARAYGNNAIAIGSNSITSTLDGTGEVNNGIAIGQQARVASNNSIALGQNSLALVPTDLKTEAYLSKEVFNAENGVVSVGNVEYKVGDATVTENRRRITNVAGGADDYDAVNVAQLKQLRATGTNYAGDDTTRVHRDLGDELTIKGGADVSTAEAKAKLTDGNIGVVANKDTNGLEVKLAKDINLTDKGSVVFGDGDTAPKLDATGLILPNTDATKTVKVSTDGISAGSQKITNVAAGTEDTDAVNVSQLNAVKTSTDDKLGEFTVGTDAAGNANGIDVDKDNTRFDILGANGNITTTIEGRQVKVGLSNTLNLTADGSIAFGNDATAPKLDAKGLTVSDTVKFTNAGISAGSQQIKNVKAGTEDTDAVNVSQLNEVKTSTDGKLAKFTVGTDAAGNAKGIDVDKDDTRFDILGANGNITTTIEGRQVKVGLTNTLNLTDAGSISFGDATNAPKVDKTGFTISESLKFTNAGISAGNQTVDNVKSAISDKMGETFTDKLNAANTANPNSAVNVSDLKNTADALTTQISNANTAANSKLESFVVGADKAGQTDGITVDKGTEGKTNRFDIVGANDNITTAVNGNAIEVGLAKDVTLTDGSVTTTKDGITTKVDGSGITISPSTGDATKAVSLTNEGLNNGGNKITNVAKGTDDSDAVNVSQLKELESKLGAAGDLTTVDKDGNPVVKGNDGNYYNPTDLNEDGTPKDDAKPVDTALGSGADTSGLGLDNKDNDKPITKDEAKDIIGGKPGADGQPGKDGLLDKTGPSLNNLVTVKDLQALAQAGLDFGGDTGEDAHRALSQKLTINGGISDESKLTDNNIGVVANGSDTLTVKLAKDIDLGKDGSVTTGNTIINNDGLTVKGEDGKPGTTVGSDGMVVNGDDGKPATTVGKDGISTNGKDGISVNGEDGSSTTIKPDGVTSKDPNGNSTVLGPNGVEVKDKDGNTVVTINDKGISNSNGGPTNLNDGLNVPGGLVVKPAEKVNGEYVPGTGTISAEGNRIQNVAPGIAPTDAVNVGQLGGVKRDLNNRMNTIGAHAAAMAALHPMEYLEEEKLSIAAGVGTFQSKQAVAVGAFYRPNDDTMFSVGGSFGGNENMFNVGVSLRVGQDSDYAKGAQNYKQAPLSTLTVLDDKVNTLEKENAALKDQLETQREQIKMLMERLGM